MVTVYQRCLANYQTRQWDLGTHVLFNATLKVEMPTAVPTPSCTAIPGYTCLGDCLLASRAAGSSPAPCLDLLLTTLETTSLDYFEYTPSTNPAKSSAIDACQVFTGPAAMGGDMGAPFQACLDHYADTGACKLPLHVWSGRSNNRMPIGTDHSKQVTNAQDKRAAARSVYQEIRNDVKTLLDSLNRTWTANGLQIAVFSAEGDMLHQYLDCVMLGALDRVDLWPAPDPLPRPFWSRRTDGSSGRDFELPCSGAQLNDRNGVPDTQVIIHPNVWPRLIAHNQ